MEERKNMIQAILGRIPVAMNPVDFLFDTLSISKESIYRRLRGEIDFTLEDMIKISSKLSVSIDEIVSPCLNGARVKQSIIFQSKSDGLFESQKTFFQLLSDDLERVERINKSRNVDIIIATNRLMVITAVHYDYMFKFYYYRWAHQTQQQPLNFCFSDVTLPDDILNLQAKLKAKTPCGIYTCILDYCFLENTIREIQYYYKRKLISEDEMSLLQGDLYKFIDSLEDTVVHKPEIEDFQNNIYISTTPIDSSVVYCKYDEEQIISLWISYGLNICSSNPGMCNIYRSWLNSLKKYASLISGCNEALQISYINRQREYVKNIINQELI